jgi:hypothetical protein
MRLPGTISNTFIDTFFEIVNASSDLPETVKNDPKWAVRFVMANMIATGEIDDIENEIKRIIENLGVTNNFFHFKTYSIEELVLDVKHYLIAWSTMKDLMATLINISFDLGIHESDISFGLLLRNEKVQNSRIPEICKQFSKKIDISKTDKLRNDAAHRGKLEDDQINDYQNQQNRLFAERFSLLREALISKEEFDKKIQELNAKLPALVASKKKEYSDHFHLTMTLNKELAAELAKIAAKNYLGQKLK